MRLLSLPLLFAICASIVRGDSSEATLGSDVSGDNSDDVVEGPEPTIFNGISVPPLPEIDGEKFNATVEKGYWFVKHYSSVSLSANLCIEWW